VSATSAAIVLLAGVASVLAAGLGTLPLHFLRGGGASLLGAANGAASGVMASVGVGLVVEGVHEGAVAALLGCAAFPCGGSGARGRGSPRPSSSSV
jgi:hypothetical protein